MSWISKPVFVNGRILSLLYKRLMTKKENLPCFEYGYDVYYNCMLCPKNKTLNYSMIKHEYKSKSNFCKACPQRSKGGNRFLQ